MLKSRCNLVSSKSATDYVRTLLPLILCIVLAMPIGAQSIFDGHITESKWGPALGTSLGGPAPGFGAGHEINSLFATSTDASLEFAIGGNLQKNHFIILFIDSRAGGFANTAFSRANTPEALQNLNTGISFDAGFLPDYCLSISTNATRSDFFFELFSLDNNAGTRVGLGTSNLSSTDNLGAAPTNGDQQKGFEISITKTLLGYDQVQQRVVKMMAMYISDGGVISNQFISRANGTEINYGSGALNFNVLAPNAVQFDPSQTLPIDFTGLQVSQFGNSVKVMWASAAEKDMLKYVVQRSGDAVDFDSIATVTALGNANASTTYIYGDAQPLQGKNFYRIKAIDKNGRSAYSPVAKIQYGYVDNSLGIFPNPVKDRINLQIIGIQRGKYDLVIYNDKGQRMLSKRIEYNGGYGLQQIPVLPNMRKGPYRLVLSNSSVFYKQSFLVQ